MHIRPLSSLTRAEVVDLARHAADLGDDFAQVNPFPSDCWRHGVFNDALRARAADLQPVG